MGIAQTASNQFRDIGGLGGNGPVYAASSSVTPGVGTVMTASFAPGWTATGVQWTRDGVDIAGATATTYVLTSSDVGAYGQAAKVIAPRVTGLSYVGLGAQVPPAPPSTLDPLTSYLAAVANRNTTPVRMVFLGDSWTEYRTVTAFGLQYTQLVQAQLRTKYPTTGIGTGGGIGYVPMDNVSIFSPYTNPWVKTGGPTLNVASGGLGLRYTVFGAGQSAIITVTGTSCILHYLKGSSSRVGYYKVDGGTAVTFETNNGVVSDDGFLPITLGAAGSHTLEVGYSSGSQVYIAGGMFFNGDELKGFHMYEAGHTAYRTTDYIGAAAGAAAQRTRIAAINPHLMEVQLGQNDFAQTAGLFISHIQFKANLKQLISEYRAAGITAAWNLVMSADTTAIKDPAQTSTWAQFQQAAREVAAEDTGGAGGASAVQFTSITDSGRIPASTGAAGGLWVDGAHVGNAGHVIVSDIHFLSISR